ncbi:TetR/AcrR family transcriptional regulator [Frondihabitans cladoniiphilus]|uniref:TetR family transcriptional regulator n=1 Tax=Frondihabitans cladoniiphilus TaxID=715785 RepID=A0ABP8VWJ9_9MICO
MARRYDSAESAKLLLEASGVEFARHGIGGARIDKIAERAGVNKASIYTYFGNKEDLFAATLEARLGELAHEVVVRSENVPAYVGQLFDFLCEHPEIVRLYEHEGMHYETTEVPDFARRETYHHDRVALIREAAQGDDPDAESIFLSLIGMAYWFIAAPQVVRMIYGPVDDAEVKRRYRAQIMETARRVVRAD